MRLTKEEFGKLGASALEAKEAGLELTFPQKLELDFLDAIEALKKTSLVVAGEELNKHSLVTSLEAAKAVLTYHKS